MEILFLVIGLLLILAGANFLTDGSVALAQRFNVSEFIVGLTIVAVGTSTPELVVSVLSAIQGNSDVAIGNVVGSNIFNVFVILGICALIVPIPMTNSNVRRDTPYVLLASLVLLVAVSDKLLHIGTVSHINRIDGVIMILLYVALIWYTIRKTHNSQKRSGDNKPQMGVWMITVMIVGGLTALVLGGDLFLNNATQIARHFGVSESVIAITLVAGGTSLPELASSIVSIVKGKSDLALGNVVGSNIANILLVLGVSATIHPLALGGITYFDIFMVVVSSVLLFITAFTFKKRKIDRWEGALFLLIYVAFIWYLIARG